MVSSAVSTGGLTAVLVKKFGVKRRVKTVGSKNETKVGNDASETSGGEEHGASESRIA